MGLLLIAVLFGGTGAGLIWLGVEERLGILVDIGAGFAGGGLAAGLLGIARAVWALARRSRELGRREYREHRRFLQPLLVSAAVALGLLAILVTHNYIVWSGIERDCELALRTDDPAEARRALNHGRTAMQNPLLVIPSELLDLWGPNRCRSAAENLHLPRADPGAQATDAPTKASGTEFARPVP